MKKALLSIIAAVASGMVYAAPAPYPLTINSQAQTAPPVLVYRASETAFRVRFTDGSTASDITGCIPFMAWSTNANATGVSTSSYTIVSATNGMVDFHFDPSAVNFAAGRYLYEVGIRSNAIPRVYRQGVFQIYNSPVGAGVSAVTWSTPVNWQALDWSNLPTITVNGVTGSIETNLGFTVTSVEADTLATVTARGNITSNTVAAFVTDTALSPFPGLYGSSVYGAGVDGYSVSSRGVVGRTLSGYGMSAEATGGGTGIFATAASSGVGLFTPHSIISESTITANTFLGNGSALTGMTVSQIAGAYPASNPLNFVTAAKFNFTNGTTMADGVLNGTNGIFFVPSGSTNRYWILGGE